MTVVRSQGVPARSSTVTATSAAVQRVHPPSFQQARLQRRHRPSAAWPNGRPSAAGSSPRPRNWGLLTACTQPGCTGTIVDVYVCGSPAGGLMMACSQGVAQSSTVATPGAVQRVPSHSFRQRLRRRHPSLLTSLA